MIYWVVGVEGLEVEISCKVVVLWDSLMLVVVDSGQERVQVIWKVRIAKQKWCVE